MAGADKPRITDFRDLLVWQEGMKLVEAVYRLTESLPRTEKYGLISQMTRAAVSVPANIAEGHGSSHTQVFLNHLSLSRGSLMELETYVLLCERLQMLKPAQIELVKDQIQRIAQMQWALMRSLRARVKS